tara:strand:+ start:40 stop:252 length:213 start_codon:yes stop_codon:yes gene_type:complete
MNKSYKIDEILLAVDILLNEEIYKNKEVININNTPLVLKNEIKEKEKINIIPAETEKIISQAEKYKKKNY